MNEDARAEPDAGRAVSDGRGDGENFWKFVTLGIDTTDDRHIGAGDFEAHQAGEREKGGRADVFSRSGEIHGGQIYTANDATRQVHSLRCSRDPA